jgi:hypothetical protein
VDRVKNQITGWNLHRSGSSSTGPSSMFPYPLRVSDEEPNDPGAYLSLIPNWEVDDTFALADGRELRIVAIDWEIAQVLIDQGFTAIWFVEPV